MILTYSGFDLDRFYLLYFNFFPTYVNSINYRPRYGGRKCQGEEITAMLCDVQVFP